MGFIKGGGRGGMSGQVPGMPPLVNLVKNERSLTHPSPKLAMSFDCTELQKIQNHLWRSLCFFDRIWDRLEERASLAKVSELAAPHDPRKVCDEYHHAAF